MKHKKGSVSDDDVSSEDIPNGNGVKNGGVTSGATNKLVKPTTNKGVKPVSTAIYFKGAGLGRR